MTMNIVDCVGFLLQNKFAITTDCNACYGRGKIYCCSDLYYIRSEYDDHVCSVAVDCHKCSEQYRLLNLMKDFFKIEERARSIIGAGEQYIKQCQENCSEVTKTVSPVKTTIVFRQYNHLSPEYLAVILAEEFITEFKKNKIELSGYLLDCSKINSSLLTNSFFKKFWDDLAKYFGHRNLLQLSWAFEFEFQNENLKNFEYHYFK